MRRTGASPIETARHFFPGVSPKEHRTIAGLYSKWTKRHGQPDEATPQPQAGQRPPLLVVQQPPPEPPMYALADQPQAEQLRELVALAWSDLHMARRARDHRGIALHRQAIAELGEQLEELRRRAGSVTKLDPVPSVVAVDIVEESKAIRLLVEAAEALRAAQAAQPGTEPTES